MIFTSRYGDGPGPSALRMCCGPCEGLGWYPVAAYPPLDPLAPRRASYDLTVAEAVAVNRQIGEGHWQADGFYFIRCPRCAGTGRCTLRETVRRIPHWLRKGAAFIWRERHSGFLEDYSALGRIRVLAWIAWGMDLAIWGRELRTRWAAR